LRLFFLQPITRVAAAALLHFPPPRALPFSFSFFRIAQCRGFDLLFLFVPSWVFFDFWAIDQSDLSIWFLPPPSPLLGHRGLPEPGRGSFSVPSRPFLIPVVVLNKLIHYVLPFFDFSFCIFFPYHALLIWFGRCLLSPFCGEVFPLSMSLSCPCGTPLTFPFNSVYAPICASTFFHGGVALLPPGPSKL